MSNSQCKIVVVLTRQTHEYSRKLERAKCTYKRGGCITMRLLTCKPNILNISFQTIFLYFYFKLTLNLHNNVATFHIMK